MKFRNDLFYFCPLHFYWAILLADHQIGLSYLFKKLKKKKVTFAIIVHHVNETFYAVIVNHNMIIAFFTRWSGEMTKNWELKRQKRDFGSINFGNVSLGMQFRIFSYDQFKIKRNQQSIVIDDKLSDIGAPTLYTVQSCINSSKNNNEQRVYFHSPIDGIRALDTWAGVEEHAACSERVAAKEPMF